MADGAGSCASVLLIGAALESAPDAMLIVDDSVTVRYANKHVTELFGFAHDQIVGHRVEALLPSGSAQPTAMSDSLSIVVDWRRGGSSTPAVGGPKSHQSVRIFLN